jgi:3-hydroxy-9,10-secoandrosta-1,3,5(10)-triene-9,17-dione monooxygenase reductase component
MTTPPAANALSATALRHFMRSWPGGVAVVTTAYGGTPAGCTVNAFISVSLRPPLVLVSLGDQSRTLATLVARGAFAVSVLTGRQRHLAERFASAVDDRFAGVDIVWRQGVPALAGAAAIAVCEVHQVIAAADHALVLGRPKLCERDADGDPLIFAGGVYHTLSLAEG